MIFTHDTELTLKAACVLISTDRVDGERLGDLAVLDTFLDSFGSTGRRDHDNALNEKSVRRLRERLANIWASADDEEGAVAQVNALLSDTKAQPWLTRHPEMPEWHLHLASVLDPLWQRMAGRDGDGARRRDPCRRAAAAQDLRGARLRGAVRDGPVAEPVADLLRYRQLR